MKIQDILKTELNKIKPSIEEEEKISELVEDLMKRLNSRLGKNAKVMMGGSFAKGTTIRKKRYDVDLFAVFNDNENLSDKLESALKKLKLKYSRLPGSRDYFGIDMKTDDVKFKIEIVPVFKIGKSEEAKNVTDVSMLHVNYIKKAIRRNPKLSDEIRMTKAFCYAQDCYGAESHIKGFSGYCLEILTVHYKSFLNLMKNASRWGDKTILDPEKHYKNKSDIMNEINGAKLVSPLILIDPVQMNRNAAAALDESKYRVFINNAGKFLKKPSKAFFEKKEFDPSKFIDESKKKKLGIFEVDAESRRVKEDISGAKLLKMHNMIVLMLEKEGYQIKDKWNFCDQKSQSYFAIKESKEIIQKGPPVARKKHAEEFKKRWKKVFVKNGNLYTKRKPKQAIEILNLNGKLLKDMGIDSFNAKVIR